MAKDGRYPFIAYRGEIGHGDHGWPIHFQIAHGVDGELRFRVKPIAYTAETVELSRIWHRPGQGTEYFRLKGVSAGGVTFESAHMTIYSIRTVTTSAGTTIAPRLQCAKGSFRSEPEGETGRLFVRYLLRGFEAFPSVETTCRLGRVSMAGAYPAPNTEKVSGHLQVVPGGELENVAEWRIEAEALCLHLQRYMSFAQSRLIRAPVQQVWDGRTYEEVIFRQSRHRRAAQAVIHPMMLQAYFECAVAAFFDPPVAVSNATFPLEWFAMDASYTETRLMNAMTALENLTQSNLAPEQTAYLADARFERIARAMRAAARAYVADHPVAPETDPASAQAETAMIAGLAGKMRDLNRRPLNEKILMLADQWRVPLDDLLVGDALARAIRARNTVVHRGWYYEPADGTPEQRDLWDHVLLMREVVIRFILTTLAYRGRYISFRGGQHDVEFPPSRD